VHVQFADCVLRQAKALDVAPHQKASLLGASLLLRFTLSGLFLKREEPICGQAFCTMLLTIFSNAATPSSTRVPSEALPCANAFHQPH